mmetsp:Transcript_10415/g.27510  ORF Transcript_10415/g.27510 Transcript_10415/m.27510 type:complete len:261 (-) Transcript_10415:354-1136(-)
MRTPWEGAEGIAWLCVADTERLQSGGFYLDRKPQVKHMAGPFFTEGSHTKNTSAEVDRMMDMLEEWSTAAARPAAPTSDEAMAADLKRPLCAMSRPIDIQAFMGRWYVAGGILTFLEQEKKNCIEDYAFDHDNNRIRVSFKMNNAKGEETELLQRAKIVNETNTQWSLSPKFGVYLPLGIAYLVLDCDTENYSYTVIGVPDRSYVWVSSERIARPAAPPRYFTPLLETYFIPTFSPTSPTDHGTRAGHGRSDLGGMRVAR